MDHFEMFSRRLNLPGTTNLSAFGDSEQVPQGVVSLNKGIARSGPGTRVATDPSDSPITALHYLHLPSAPARNSLRIWCPESTLLYIVTSSR
ncbi:hypothetical protein SCOR_25250 [Sulfidibacter corallicola]